MPASRRSVPGLQLATRGTRLLLAAAACLLLGPGWRVAADPGLVAAFRSGRHALQVPIGPGAPALDDGSQACKWNVQTNSCDADAEHFLGAVGNSSFARSEAEYRACNRGWGRKCPPHLLDSGRCMDLSKDVLGIAACLPVNSTSQADMLAIFRTLEALYQGSESFDRFRAGCPHETAFSMESTSCKTFWTALLAVIGCTDCLEDIKYFELTLSVQCGALEQSQCEDPDQLAKIEDGICGHVGVVRVDGEQCRVVDTVDPPVGPSGPPDGPFALPPPPPLSQGNDSGNVPVGPPDIPNAGPNTTIQGFTTGEVIGIAASAVGVVVVLFAVAVTCLVRRRKVVLNGSGDSGTANVPLTGGPGSTPMPGNNGLFISPIQYPTAFIYTPQHQMPNTGSVAGGPTAPTTQGPDASATLSAVMAGSDHSLQAAGPSQNGTTNDSGMPFPRPGGALQPRLDVPLAPIPAAHGQLMASDVKVAGPASGYTITALPSLDGRLPSLGGTLAGLPRSNSKDGEDVGGGEDDNGALLLGRQLDWIQEQRRGEMFKMLRLSSAPNSRRMGGQGAVVFAEHRDFGERRYAIKFFFSDSAFELEQDACCTPELQALMPPVYTIERSGAARSTAEMPPPLNSRDLPKMIVMERGESLTDFTQRRFPDFFTTLQIMVHITERLMNLHEAGWVHRDLKPGNTIWLPSQNQWSLIDFGVAAKEGEMVSMAFSLAYAPPEVVTLWAQGVERIEAHGSTDVWALGVMCWELLTQEQFFKNQPTCQEVVNALTGVKPLPTEGELHKDTLRKLGNPNFRQILLTMLERDPSKRPTVKHLLYQWKFIFQQTGLPT